MFEAGKTDNGCREYPVGVGRAGKHKAVCSEQNRSPNIGELLLLVLPSGAKIALKLGILLECWVATGGQHLSMSIDVNTFAGRLLKEPFQVKQVMSAHDVSTDGKADPSDFLCCIQFCEKYSSEMRIAEALEMLNASKHIDGLEVGLIKEGDEF